MSNQHSLSAAALFFGVAWGLLSVFEKDKAKSESYMILSNIWLCGALVIAGFMK